MEDTLITRTLNKYLRPQWNFVHGFADMGNLISADFPGYRYAISIGKKLDDNIVNELNDGPTLEYFRHYNTINSELTSLSEKIGSELISAGVECMVIKPTIKLSSEPRYLRNLTYELSHKMVATRAGLGWIGKTDLLISFKFGPRLRLVSILLKHNPGVTAVPVVKSKCGKCNICVESCPAGAANGMLWNKDVHRDDFFDPFTCRDKCGELARQKLNVDEHICGLCVYVCPAGRKGFKSALP